MFTFCIVCVINSFFIYWVIKMQDKSTSDTTKITSLNPEAMAYKPRTTTTTITSLNPKVQEYKPSKKRSDPIPNSEYSSSSSQSEKPLSLNPNSSVFVPKTRSVDTTTNTQTALKAESKAFIPSQTIITQILKPTSKAFVPKIRQRSNSMLNVTENKQVDFFSVLPNDIIFTILSFFSPKEFVRICLVSKIYNEKVLALIKTRSGVLENQFSGSILNFTNIIPSQFKELINYFSHNKHTDTSIAAFKRLIVDEKRTVDTLFLRHIIKNERRLLMETGELEFNICFTFKPILIEKIKEKIEDKTIKQRGLDKVVQLTVDSTDPATMFFTPKQAVMHLNKLDFALMVFPKEIYDNRAYSCFAKTLNTGNRVWIDKIALIDPCYCVATCYKGKLTINPNYHPGIELALFKGLKGNLNENQLVEYINNLKNPVSKNESPQIKGPK